MVQHIVVVAAAVYIMCSNTAAGVVIIVLLVVALVLLSPHTVTAHGDRACSEKVLRLSPNQERTEMTGPPGGSQAGKCPSDY